MKQLTLTIPGNPPTLNHVYRNVSVNRRVTTGEGKAWQRMVQQLAVVAMKQQRWEISQGVKIVAEVRIYWPTKRKRDVENVGKLLWDSLEGFVFDNDQWLLPRYMDFQHDKANPRVEIKFFPLDPQAERIEQGQLAI